MTALTPQQKKALVDELSRIREDIVGGQITGIFLATTRDDGEADHVSFAAKGKLFELLGQVEKVKFDVQLKVHRVEINS